MKDNNKYWMVVDQKNVIWGIGTTPSNALADAIMSIDLVSIPHKVDENSLKPAIRCSKDLFDELSDYDATADWIMLNGVAELTSHVNMSEYINEMRSLIDGAYDLVFTFKPSSPAQTKWRDNWLEKARKYGASLD